MEGESGKGGLVGYQCLLWPGAKRLLCFSQLAIINGEKRGRLTKREIENKGNQRWKEVKKRQEKEKEPEKHIEEEEKEFHLKCKKIHREEREREEQKGKKEKAEKSEKSQTKQHSREEA